MTHSLGLREAADNLGIQVAPIRMIEIEGALQRELDSIEVYQDAVEAFAILQDYGIAIALCSNLAAPYGPAVKALMPNHAAYALSYELGMMKPEPEIYRSACNELGIVPEHLFEGTTEVVMIGDSPRCDRDGPRTIGIHGFYFDRKGSGPIHDLKQFAEFVVNSPRDSHR
ncbi:HAD family hydrolase [Pseudomonas sp. yb_9]|uniref:HAD family hydrolase n=1 Tax=Pseudomonas sp. yb_9 TaxID=3367222 RepID=UPI00370C3545